MKDMLKGLDEGGAMNFREIVGSVSEIDRNVKIMGTIAKMIEDNIVMDGARESEFHVRPDAQKELTVVSIHQKRVNKEIA